jgi:MFS family permease
MGDLVITPIVSSIYEAFGDQSEFLVNLGITGPAIVGLPFGLAAGFLCDRIDKKLVMVAGFAIFTFSSVFGIAFENLYWFVIMRQLATGVGWGITNTAALAILADLFVDKGKHGKYVGWYNAAMSLIGALLAFTSGHLALEGWQCAYRTYIAAVPVLIMLIAFLPGFPPIVSLGTTEDGAGSGSADFTVERGWWRNLVPLAVQVLVIASCYYVILYMISIYVADSGAGDEAFTGMLTSTMTISSALGSFVFGAAYERFRTKVYLPTLFVIGTAFFVLAFFPHPTVVVVTLVITGFSWPFFFCYFYSHCTAVSPANRAGTATSIVAAANGVAATASSYLLMGSIATTGGTSLTVYPYFGAVMLAAAIVSTAVTIVLSRRG